MLKLRMRSTLTALHCLSGIAMACAAPDDDSTPTEQESSAGDSPDTEDEHPLPDGLIDNMEDQDAKIHGAEGRNGHWYVETTDSHGTLVPSIAEGFVMTHLEPNRDGSGWAACLQGSGEADWAAWLMMSFKVDPDTGKSLPWDASKYEGIRFWIRAGELNESSLQISFPTTETHPDGGICSLENGTCYSDYGVVTDLSPNWVQMEFVFSELERPWGVGPPGKFFDPTQTMGLTIGPYIYRPFDYCIDDIEFF